MATPLDSTYNARTTASPARENRFHASGGAKRVSQTSPMSPEKTSPAEMDTQVETTPEPISHTLPPSPLSATPPSPAVIAKLSETPPV